jgi:hypothetical protein
VLATTRACVYAKDAFAILSLRFFLQFPRTPKSREQMSAMWGGHSCPPLLILALVSNVISPDTVFVFGWRSGSPLRSIFPQPRYMKARIGKGTTLVVPLVAEKNSASASEGLQTVGNAQNHAQ